MREVASTNVVLGHLLLEITGKEFGKEKAQIDCFDKSYI